MRVEAVLYLLIWIGWIFVAVHVWYAQRQRSLILRRVRETAEVSQQAYIELCGNIRTLAEHREAQMSDVRKIKKHLSVIDDAIYAQSRLGTEMTDKTRDILDRIIVIESRTKTIEEKHDGEICL